MVVVLRDGGLGDRVDADRVNPVAVNSSRAVLRMRAVAARACSKSRSASLARSSGVIFISRASIDIELLWGNDDLAARDRDARITRGQQNSG